MNPISIKKLCFVYLREICENTGYQNINAQLWMVGLQGFLFSLAFNYIFPKFSSKNVFTFIILTTCCISSVQRIYTVFTFSRNILIYNTFLPSNPPSLLFHALLYLAFLQILLRYTEVYSLFSFKLLKECEFHVLYSITSRIKCTYLENTG